MTRAEDFPGSKLDKLNKARSRTAALQPLCASNPAASPYLNGTRFTTLLELIQNSDKADKLAGEYESHLMIEDIYNPGLFLPKPLYDYSKETMAGGKFMIDVHEGELIVPGDTMIYWK